jgi:carbamoyltransferase
MSNLFLGIARARLGAAAALVDPDNDVAAACEENRLTRARQAPTTGPPELAIAELLRFLGREAREVTVVAATADDTLADWAHAPRALPVDAHRAHAAYAMRSTSCSDALALVCDVHRPRGWSAWRCRADAPPEPAVDDLGAFPLAGIYGLLTEALGLQPTRDEHLVEAMARAGRNTHAGLAALIQLGDDGVTVDPRFASEVYEIAAAGDEQTRKDVAASVQQKLGDCLAQLLMRLSAAMNGPSPLCLSGGLFFNTYFTTRAATSGLFGPVHVPPHPGRNGTAVGAALLAGGAERPASGGASVASPYLGPEYSDAEIKDALDNCKLSYDLLREDRLIDDVLYALSRGRLVGWFHGRLEWGPRALGHRSVLASPFAPHTLSNLNAFLKRRPAYRSYGVSVPLASVGDLFDGPPASPFMQYEYRPRDPAQFRTILPPGVETVRVHTVDDREPRFHRLLQAWGEKTGTPVLVNTSFNGFHEPLVCSPRDAIRVFYGTGLDILALENFFLRK